MPTLVWIFLFYFGTIITSQGQADPCHCLSFGLNFYQGAEELAFIPVPTTIQQEGKLIQVYEEQNLGQLTAIAVLSSPPRRNSPPLEMLDWKEAQMPEISFHAAWNFDLEAAYQRRAAFAENQKKELANLYPFQFLPPMNNTLYLEIYLLEYYQKDQ